jgi:hypothetical protein
MRVSENFHLKNPVDTKKGEGQRVEEEAETKAETGYHSSISDICLEFTRFYGKG